MGYPSTDSRKQTRGIETIYYNPINTECLPVEELSILYTILTTPVCLIVNPIRQQKNVSTKFGDIPKGSPIAVQEKLHSNYVLMTMDAEDFPPMPV